MRVAMMMKRHIVYFLLAFFIGFSAGHFQTGHAQELSAAAKADIKIAKAIEKYRQLLPTLQGAKKIRVSIELASSYLQQGAAKRAYSVLSEYGPPTPTAVNDNRCCEDAGLPRELYAAYYFTRARALNDIGKTRPAVESYQWAVEAEPRFVLAVRAGMNALLASKQPQYALKATADWLDILIGQGRTQLVAETLMQGLHNEWWWQQPSYNRLLISLARYFATVEVGRQQFQEDEWEESLSTLKEYTVHHTAIAEIIDIYNGIKIDDNSGNVDVQFAPGAADKLVSALLQGEGPEDARAVLSSFYKSVGDDYMNAENAENAEDIELMTKQALWRYAAAWSLQPTNMDAGLYSAAALLELQDTWPNSKKALQEFIHYLFEEKGKAYRTNLGNNWRNILRFHTVLGTIFANRGEWGNSYNSRSAIFQWEYALEAQQHLQRDLPVPELRARLARAYFEGGEIDLSVQQYFAASDDAAALGRTKMANQLLEQATVMDRQDVFDRQQLIFRNELIGRQELILRHDLIDQSPSGIDTFQRQLRQSE
ncbi:MAG: hypothetical protein HOC88_09875 [Rhodospirillaceae bacterium]|nr:hypothetical protein [Rhodospirillaceae bacterium]